MFTEEDRNVIKRINDIFERNKGFYYANTVLYHITKKPYVKDDVFYIPVQDHNGRHVVIEKEAGQLHGFYSHIRIEGEEITFRISVSNNAWYKKKRKDEAIVWSIDKPTAYLVFSDAFVKENNIDASTYVNVEFNQLNEIYLFRSNHKESRIKFVSKQSKRMGLSCAKWAKTPVRYGGVSFFLKLYPVYRIENKTMHGVPCWKLIPKGDI